MQLDLTGRVAVVTGASRGVGFHIARRLATSGAAVGLVARSADALHQTVQELRRARWSKRCLAGSFFGAGGHGRLPTQPKTA